MNPALYILDDGSLPKLTLGDEGTLILKFRTVGASEMEDGKIEYRLEYEVQELNKDEVNLDTAAEKAANSIPNPMRIHWGPG